MANAKVTKIMMWPSRKVNLGNYNTAELSAGLEVSFDKPVPMAGKEVKKAFKDGLELLKEEFKIQYEPYRIFLGKDKKEGGENA